MGTVKLDFLRSSDVTNKSLKSLILEVRTADGTEVVSVFCTDDWRVNICIEGNVLELSRINFLEIFHQASLFVADENFAMIKEAAEGLE
jgi:hypothetical protein